MAEAFLFLRGASFGLLLLMCLRLWLAYRHRWTGRLMLALCVGLCAYCVAPFLGSVPIWEHVAVMFAISIPAVFWLFSRALFGDSGGNERPPGVLSLVGIAVFVGVSFASYWIYGVREGNSPTSAYALPLFYFSYAMRLAYVVLALTAVLAHWRQDLVENRRRLRLFIIATTGIYIFGVAFVELLLGVDSAPLALELTSAALMIAMLLLANYWLAQSNQEVLAATLGMASRVDESSESHRSVLPDSSARETPLSLTQKNWLKALHQYIETDQGYHTNDLTIRRLAQTLSIPEHLLRRLINQHLGYRNFNEYLNHYRINDAAARLADPEQERLPILTIALEVGYASLTPFNRAFKARYDQTPSEYRRALPASID